MFSVQEMQRVDRELSLELTESPINPAFIHMSAPLVNGYDPLFYLQLTARLFGNGVNLKWLDSNLPCPSRWFSLHRLSTELVERSACWDSSERKSLPRNKEGHITGGPSSRLENKPTINSWTRHALCDSMLSYERNRWKFEHVRKE